MIRPQIRFTNQLLQSFGRNSSAPICAGRVRAFSTASGEYAREEQAEAEASNAFKNQHIIYVPKKQLNFDVRSPDGKMALIFESGQNFDRRAGMWKYALGTTLPALVLADYSLSVEQLMFAVPAVLLPNIYFMFDAIRMQVLFKNEVQRIWLLRNGAQIVMETFDGVLHKASIIDNDEYQLIKAKSSVVFGVKTAGRNFFISSKDASIIDYDLLDRIVRAICVDTRRSTQVFHHLINKRIPANLKPQELNKFYPNTEQIKTPLLNSNAFAWQYLNRTIYRPAEHQTFWLRENTRNLPQSDSQKELFELTGLKNYCESKFYAIYKISVEDFVTQARENPELAKSVWEDGEGAGRRAIMSLRKIQEITRKKLLERERIHTFASKFLDEADISKEEVRQTGFFRSDMLY